MVGSGCTLNVALMEFASGLDIEDKSEESRLLSFCHEEETKW